MPPSSGRRVSQESILLAACLTYSSTWRWRHTFISDVRKLLSDSTASELSYRSENHKSNSLQFNLFFVCLVSRSIFNIPPSFPPSRARSFPRQYEKRIAKNKTVMAIQLSSAEDKQIRTTFAYVLLYVFDYRMEIVSRSNICCNIVYIVNRDINITLIHVLCCDYRYLSKFICK